jgi:hypothetical protein
MLRVPKTVTVSVIVTIHFGTSYKEISVGAVILLISLKRRVIGKKHI